MAAQRRPPEGDGCNNADDRKEAHAYSFPVQKLRKTPITKFRLALILMWPFGETSTAAAQVLVKRPT